MKLVIFDIDGTLCYSQSADDICFITAFKKAANIEINNTDWNSYEHATEYSIACKLITKELDKRADPVLLELVKENYLCELKNAFYSDKSSFIAVPGALELIEHLKNHPNYRVAIATGGFYRSAKYKLDTLGFHIEDIPLFSSEQFGTKPEMLRELIRIESQHVTFEKIVYVGDRPYDLETCRELGINFIGIDYENNKKLRNLGADRIINDFTPIETFVSLLC
jgi:phosphoglycolate phosphatase-like HAD superfamily hydrolase